MVKAVQYFNFQDALSAIRYYEEVFGAEVVSISTGDDEMFTDSNMPDGVDGDFVMHSEIKIFGHSFYISSTWNKSEINNDGAMTCFVFDLNDENEKTQMKAFYQKAVDSGVEVQMELGETEWTPMFASFKDKCGVNWMLSGE